jgi:hypothetical protein
MSRRAKFSFVVLNVCLPQVIADWLLTALSRNGKRDSGKAWQVFVYSYFIIFDSSTLGDRIGSQHIKNQRCRDLSSASIG